MVRMILLIVVALTCGSVHVFSQERATSDRARFFVSGGVALEADNTWGDSVPVGSAVTASAGIDLSRHVGVRVALEVPKVYSTESASSFGFFRARSTEQHRSICWSVSADGHRALTDRVRLGVLGGITMARRPNVFLTSRDQLGAGDIVVGHVDTTTTYVFTWLGLTAGVEAPVMLTRHLSLVPGATVTVFPLAEYRPHHDCARKHGTTLAILNQDTRIEGPE